MSQVKNLNLKYSDFEINIPEMELLDTGVTALCGPSGSGKTTIMRALLGLEKCPQMSWEMNGENLAALKPADRRIGIVFQSLELLPHMTARQNIMFAAEARGTKGADKKLNELADMLNATQFLDKNVGLLSGGERQRVALMRALIGEPRLLFLDEPFSALDKPLRAEARKLVNKIIVKHNIPTLLITHDDEDLNALANKVIRIENGHIIST